MQQLTMGNQLKITPRYKSRRYTLLFILQQYDKDEANRKKKSLLNLLGIGDEMLNKYLYMKKGETGYSLSPERIKLIAEYFDILPEQVITPKD